MKDGNNPRGEPSAAYQRQVWKHHVWTEGPRFLADETPVAFSYHSATHAVMMATPADLDDFAIGFSLTEGIIREASEITDLDIAAVPGGIDLRMLLKPSTSDSLARRRRHMAGPAGCGLCGIESLAEAVRALPQVASGFTATPAAIQAAMRAMPSAQALNIQTRAVHAAAFWRENAPLLLREDVGRHNALDKLAGAIAQAGIDPAAGMILLSSRISVEMVQKAAFIGAGLVVAVSAPTALAVRVADGAGVTLVGIARDDGFEVFTHPARISTRMSGATLNRTGS